MRTEVSNIARRAQTQDASAARVRFLVRNMRDPLAADGPNVIRNLSRTPKKISAVYVYDRRGTELFEQQCRTPEYYLRRVEAGLLRAHAGEITELCRFPPIVELGAGTAEKTRILLAEYSRRDLRCDYFPIDVDLQTLADAAYGLVRDHPQLFVHCLGGTYEESLPALPRTGRPRLFLFLGSSLGNMETPEMIRLLEHIFDHSASGDFLLLGADLHKDAAIINRAYNDAAGFGARSTLNMLSHLNRRYDGNFAVERFAYRSTYNANAHCNEVRIESLAAQSVMLRGLEYRVAFRKSELIDAELMWKFEPHELVLLLQRAGFSMMQEWIEPIQRYGIFLLRHQ